MLEVKTPFFFYQLETPLGSYGSLPNIIDETNPLALGFLRNTAGDGAQTQYRPF